MLFRSIDIGIVGDATDIHNTKFDSPQNPIAVNGTLDSTIKPMTRVQFLDIINSTQRYQFADTNLSFCLFFKENGIRITYFCSVFLQSVIFTIAKVKFGLDWMQSRSWGDIATAVIK